MGSGSRAWTPVAAYLYVLHLDGASLAWEYLRRNTLYQTDWREQAHRDSRFIQRWGLACPENPAFDACMVQPVWRTEPDALLRIFADEGDAPTDAEPFSLWAIPGRKSLLHDGRRLLLTTVLGTRVLRMAIANDVSDGHSFAYAIRSGPRARARWQAVQEHLRALRVAEPVRRYALSPRPSRLAVLHMRALQALDGRAAAASHRDIAAAIFGDQRVAEDWHADSELRAQVRHLLRRGNAFMRGDYRGLITQGGGYSYGDQPH